MRCGEVLFGVAVYCIKRYDAEYDIIVYHMLDIEGRSLLTDASLAAIGEGYSGLTSIDIY